jgi:transcriptional regulator with XRE-family HTH domain
LWAAEDVPVSSMQASAIVAAEARCMYAVCAESKAVTRQSEHFLEQKLSQCSRQDETSRLQRAMMASKTFSPYTRQDGEREDRKVDAPPAVTFGALLRRHRVAAGLTQEELAEQASISRRSISDIECGVPHRPRRDTVTLLAEALNLAEVDRSTFIEAAAQAGRMTAVAPAISLKWKAPGPDALRRWQSGKVRISVMAAAIALAFVLSAALIGQRLVHYGCAHLPRSRLRRRIAAVGPRRSRRLQ